MKETLRGYFRGVSPPPTLTDAHPAPALPHPRVRATGAPSQLPRLIQHPCSLRPQSKQSRHLVHTHNPSTTFVKRRWSGPLLGSRLTKRHSQNKEDLELLSVPVTSPLKYPHTIGISPKSPSYSLHPSTLIHGSNCIQKEERAPTSKPWELVNQELKFKTNALSCGDLFFSLFLQFCYTMTYYAILEEPHPRGPLPRGRGGDALECCFPAPI